MTKEVKKVKHSAKPGAQDEERDIELPVLKMTFFLIIFAVMQFEAFEIRWRAPSRGFEKPFFNLTHAAQLEDVQAAYHRHDGKWTEVFHDTVHRADCRCNPSSRGVLQDVFRDFNEQFPQPEFALNPRLFVKPEGWEAARTEAIVAHLAHKNLATWAAFTDNVELLRWAHERGHALTEEACAVAAYRGSSGVLAFLRANGGKFSAEFGVHANATEHFDSWLIAVPQGFA